MYKWIRNRIQWAFHSWIMTWYIYVLVEFIVHDLWDMPILAEPRLMTYVRVIGTKGKHVSDTWDEMQVWVVSGRWEWITWPCTHIPHMYLYLPFCDYLNYVLNSVLLKLSVCKYSFETCIVNISLVDYDLPATAFKIFISCVFPNGGKYVLRRVQGFEWLHSYEFLF